MKTKTKLFLLLISVMMLVALFAITSSAAVTKEVATFDELKAAATATDADWTIKFTANITATSSFKFTTDQNRKTDIQVDLNGYTLTVAQGVDAEVIIGGYTVQYDLHVYLFSSQEGGTIDSSASTAGFLYTNDGGGYVLGNNKAGNAVKTNFNMVAQRLTSRTLYGDGVRFRGGNYYMLGSQSVFIDADYDRVYERSNANFYACNTTAKLINKAVSFTGCNVYGFDTSKLTAGTGTTFNTSVLQATVQVGSAKPAFVVSGSTFISGITAELAKSSTVTVTLLSDLTSSTGIAFRAGRLNLNLNGKKYNHTGSDQALNIDTAAKLYVYSTVAGAVIESDSNKAVLWNGGSGTTFVLGSDTSNSASTLGKNLTVYGKQIINSYHTTYSSAVINGGTYHIKAGGSFAKDHYSSKVFLVMNATVWNDSTSATSLLGNVPGKAQYKNCVFQSETVMPLIGTAELNQFTNCTFVNATMNAAKNVTYTNCSVVAADDVIAAGLNDGLYSFSYENALGSVSYVVKSTVDDDRTALNNVLSAARGRGLKVDGVLKLLKDVTLSDSLIACCTNVQIDLNGYTVTTPSYVVFSEGVNVYLFSSVANANIVLTGDAGVLQVDDEYYNAEMTDHGSSKTASRTTQYYGNGYIGNNKTKTANPRNLNLYGKTFVYSEYGGNTSILGGNFFTTADNKTLISGRKAVAVQNAYFYIGNAGVSVWKIFNTWNPVIGVSNSTFFFAGENSVFAKNDATGKPTINLTNCTFVNYSIASAYGSLTVNNTTGTSVALSDLAAVIKNEKGYVFNYVVGADFAPVQTLLASNAVLNNTVVLMKDFTLTQPIDLVYACEIDFNGKSLTFAEPAEGSYSYMIGMDTKNLPDIYASFKVYSSVAGAKMMANEDRKFTSAIFQTDGSVTFTVDATNMTLRGTFAYNGYTSGAKANFIGGNWTLASADSVTEKAFVFRMRGANVTVNGGTYTYTRKTATAFVNFDSQTSFNATGATFVSTQTAMPMGALVSTAAGKLTNCTLTNVTTSADGFVKVSVTDGNVTDVYYVTAGTDCGTYTGTSVGTGDFTFVPTAKIGKVTADKAVVATLKAQNSKTVLGALSVHVNLSFVLYFAKDAGFTAVTLPDASVVTLDQTVEVVTVGDVEYYKVVYENLSPADAAAPFTVIAGVTGATEQFNLVASVASYGAKVLAASESDTEKQLVLELLNYVKLASQFFGEVNSKDVAVLNKLLTDNAATRTTYTALAAAENAGEISNFVSAAVLIESNPGIVIKLESAELAANAVVTGGNATVEGDTITVTFGLVADFTKTFTVEAGDQTLNFNAANYMALESVGEAEQAVFEALLSYVAAAKAYFTVAK